MVAEVSDDLYEWTAVATNQPSHGYVRFRNLDLWDAMHNGNVTDTSFVYVDHRMNSQNARKVATLVDPSVAISARHYHHNVGDELVYGAETTTVVRVEARAEAEVARSSRARSAGIR